jgi:hypothetical protein
VAAVLVDVEDADAPPPLGEEHRRRPSDAARRCRTCHDRTAFHLMIFHLNAPSVRIRDNPQ